ncbi:Glutathione S-transferase-like protein gedE like [Verticillium longisporum]|nr:Glutathione S-transferase-like protein gedE like [Verticillium longisporum]
MSNSLGLTKHSSYILRNYYLPIPNLTTTHLFGIQHVFTQAYYALWTCRTQSVEGRRDPGRTRRPLCDGKRRLLRRQAGALYPPQPERPRAHHCRPQHKHHALGVGISSFPEKHHLRQFLHFQASGQGPYFGQAVWFAKFHPEDLPSAKERYVEQTVRVLSVLDKLLEGKEYLVGNKCTYADIAFVNWNATAENVILKSDWDEKVEKKYPNFVAWHRRVTERPIIKDVLQRQAAGR